MAGSDIKAVTRTATGAFFGGSARIRGIYIKTNSSGSPAFIIVISYVGSSSVGSSANTTEGKTKNEIK